MSEQAKNRLLKTVKILAGLGVIMVLLVLLDFTFNFSKPDKQYRYNLPELKWNQPVLLSSDNLLIVVARYDKNTLAGLSKQGRLGRISESFTQQQPRVDTAGFFVARAYGTDMGCPLEIQADGFAESCSNARYDLLGRSLEKQRYPDLKIPEYTLSREFKLLTIE
ncbi:MAG: hypothetical protein QNJ69_14720 [Gammaproteobacteria bacterium]|nr:hypothetical protein [Gammaproteobacteria bacterium]